MNIFELVALVRRSWILLVITTIAGALIGFLVTVVQPTTYTATTEVYVTGVPQEGSNALQAGDAARAEVQSYVEIIDSNAVLDPVAKSVGGGLTASDLSGEVKAEATMETSVITITVSDEDPQRAAKIANATATQLANTADQLGRTSADAPSSVKVTQLAAATAPSSKDGSTLLYVVIGAILGFVLGYIIAVVRLALRRSSEMIEDSRTGTTTLPATGAAHDDVRSRATTADARSARTARDGEAGAEDASATDRIFGDDQGSSASRD